MIHIVNGDVLANKLKNIEGEIIVWREMYDFGPLEEQLTEAVLNKRAKYFENSIGVPKELFIETSMKQEEALNRIQRNDDVTLWFEHDRYDQIMLIYILNRLKGISFNTLKIVSINNHPSVKQFHSLGQLSENELKKLFVSDRREVSRKQIDDAALAWEYYTSDNPVLLHDMLQNEELSLPFLKKAIEVHYSYFPHPADGLNELERTVLKLLNEEALLFNELFQIITNERVEDGLTDLQFSAILMKLSPLIQVTDKLPRLNGNNNPLCSITNIGKLVLDDNSKKRTDYSPIDWWVGGVHLTDHGWYYDGENLIKKS
ncbi:hypothetical protein CIB95_08095 [Lottiidibacillus patelloidae]|uniref:DUF1835 domain-containing protein n=1 Tax=Lottiidibacillus patelloidae TaxID=2670334 RepID=A0A263BUJ0_9BACI|nr:DUF1835 domain-containing protein [Lottiidibacillus patelloidae]OZM57411.1 hypothetical protein CIB95_08095 [Lottiidibacillus patelloidae]